VNGPLLRAGLLAAGASAALPSLSASKPPGDWPQWLGPTRNGVAADAGVFTGRPSIRLEKAWARPLETGQAALAIGGGRVFTLFRDAGDDHAVALDAATGTEVWRVKLDRGVESPWLTGPPSTPAFDDGRVFTLSAACRLRGHDAASGRALWEVDLKQSFGVQFPVGCASSPFVEKSRLYVNSGGTKDHRFAAFDPKTGSVLWTAKAAERTVNASPAAVDLAGVRQILVHHLSADGQLGITALRLSDGGVLWTANVARGFSFETPQAIPGDRVFLQTANELHMLQVTREDESWSASPLWRSGDLQAYVSPPVFHAGHLYGFGGDYLACVDAGSGRTVWKEKTYPASLILVDGHLVALSTSSGLLRVVEASSAGYRERARIQLLSRGAPTLAPPAYAGRRIFVRNEEEVAAVDVH
jgi:outer membrane protein assembly factor BamB